MVTAFSPLSMMPGCCRSRYVYVCRSREILYLRGCKTSIHHDSPGERKSDEDAPVGGVDPPELGDGLEGGASLRLSSPRPTFLPHGGASDPRSRPTDQIW